MYIPCSLSPVDFPKITRDPLSQTIASGYSVSLTVSVTGGNLMYQWQKDGVNITGANSARFYISRAGENDTGVYRCVVSNTGGMVTSKAASVTGRYL